MNTKKTSGTSLIANGVISFLAGLVLLFFSDISQSTFVVILSAYAVVLGISQIVAARGEREDGKGIGYLVMLGVYSVAAGLVLLFFAEAELSLIITLVAAYVVITGIAEMIAAYVYRAEMGGYSWLIGSGAVRLIFGIFLLVNTGVALSTLVFYVAIYAMVEGVVTTVFGYEVREEIGKYHSQLA